MATGRPTKFKDIDLNQVKKLAQRGWTDLEMCDFFGIARSTWFLWKGEHTEFSDTLKKWKKDADKRVERSLYERAIGYSCIDTKFATHEGQITDEREYIRHYPPDTTAAIFWLKNRKPKQWREKQEVEHSVRTVKLTTKRFDGTKDPEE